MVVPNLCGVHIWKQLRPNVLFIFRAEETQKVTARQITTRALPSAPRCRKLGVSTKWSTSQCFRGICEHGTNPSYSQLVSMWTNLTFDWFNLKTFQCFYQPTWLWRLSPVPRIATAQMSMPKDLTLQQHGGKLTRVFLKSSCHHQLWHWKTCFRCHVVGSD